MPELSCNGNDMDRRMKRDAEIQRLGMNLRYTWSIFVGKGKSVVTGTIRFLAK